MVLECKKGVGWSDVGPIRTIQNAAVATAHREGSALTRAMRTFAGRGSHFDETIVTATIA